MGTRTCTGCGSRLVPTGKAFLVLALVFLLVNAVLQYQVLEGVAFARTLSAAAALVASLFALNVMARAGYVAMAPAPYGSRALKVAGAVFFVAWVTSLVARDLLA